MLRDRILPQTEVMYRAILLEDSPCCGVPHLEAGASEFPQNTNMAVCWGTARQRQCLSHGGSENTQGEGTVLATKAEHTQGQGSRVSPAAASAGSG